MFNNQSILAVIPARSGSKRLPRKNILDLAGKPLIAWSIEAAHKSCYIDETIVSTDSEEIANIARICMGDVPFLRPICIADDEAKSIDVVMHAIDFCKRELHKRYDYVILLQPTSPLRDHADIDHAIEYFFQKKADAVISVCESGHSPLWMNTLPADLSMKQFLRQEIKEKRSQELEQYYRVNGAIYINAVDKLYREKTFFMSDNVYAYVMSDVKSIDIDTEIDFKIAEYYIEQAASKTL